MGERYSSDSYFPNWPKWISPNHWANYCGPVITSLQQWLLDEEEMNLWKKVVNEETDFTETEIRRVNEIYTEKIEFILMTTEQ